MSAVFPGKDPEQRCFEALRAGRFRIRNCGACGNHLSYPLARSGAVFCLDPI
jgi:hypothetical protein